MKENKRGVLPVRGLSALQCMLQFKKQSRSRHFEKYKLSTGLGLSANQIGLNKKMFAALFEEDNLTQKSLVTP